MMRNVAKLNTELNRVTLQWNDDEENEGPPRERSPVPTGDLPDVGNESSDGNDGLSLAHSSSPKSTSFDNQQGSPMADGSDQIDGQADKLENDAMAQGSGQDDKSRDKHAQEGWFQAILSLFTGSGN
jgi:hypothetical protein